MIKKLMISFLIICSMLTLCSCGGQKSSEIASEPIYTLLSKEGDKFEIKKSAVSFQTVENISNKNGSRVLRVLSEEKGYSVTVSIIDTKLMMYDVRKEELQEYGGYELTAGQYSGYTFPKKEIDAAFFDAGVKKGRYSLIIAVMNAGTNGEMPINEIMKDEKLIKLISGIQYVN